ncbi:MFS transporter [Saccharomonospora xinjiangensis]|uniref:MFS transporter n=1 Tax=Saccharomonospora xinjiangensis TaxID=75294 RepID=UPI00106FACC6|nr:MFS transporter [Saccharomonospora xinjiangensis]QBQ61369.1 Inner membrane transport protein YdhP [Saccharomonospora xinjiangensis]
MPHAVYILSLGIFTMVTSEFAVAGLLSTVATGLGVSVPQAGYLITAFAAAMALGGPVLTMLLSRRPPKPALLTLFAVFGAGNVLAAVAPNYAVMFVARVITGVAAQAFFGLAISLAAQLTRPQVRGRAVAVVMNGLMLGTLLGLPMSTVVGENFGWRATFWVVTGLAAVAAIATVIALPAIEATGADGLRAQLGVFRSRTLLLALCTSTLVIGATFAGFSYFQPILTEVSGIDGSVVPLLLVGYGAATVVGNMVVGRLADRSYAMVQVWGLALNAAFLATFALLADNAVFAVSAMMGIGLVGVTMNPAMVVRVHRAGNAGPLVNTVHGSFITLGVMIGSFAGGLAIDLAGLRAPLWLGAVLALIGIGTVLPELVRPRRAAVPAPVAAPSPSLCEAES